MAEATDHYQVLGVASTATDPEIKRAYFRGVRKHPPEKDPEGFKRLRQAYETLSDPRARKQYDAMSTYGDRIESLHKEAAALIESEQYEEAGHKLKRILALNPEAHAARQEIAFCLFCQGDYARAVVHLDHLCREQEPVSSHLVFAAQVRQSWSRDERTSESQRKRLQEEAIDLYKRAAEANRLNAEPYLGLARIYHDQGGIDLALGCIERAVDADGVVDFQDFDALFLGCTIHLASEDSVGFKSMVDRIVELSDDPEHWSYAGWVFARTAIDLCGNGAFDAAAQMAEAGLRLAPDEPMIRNLKRESSDLSALAEEYSRIPEEEDFLRNLLGLEVTISVSDSTQTEELEKEWSHALQVLGIVQPARLQQWAEKLSQECPTFYRRNRELVNHMLEVARRGVAHDEASGYESVQELILRALLAGRNPESLADALGGLVVLSKEELDQLVELCYGRLPMIRARVFEAERREGKATSDVGGCVCDICRREDPKLKVETILWRNATQTDQLGRQGFQRLEGSYFICAGCRRKVRPGWLSAMGKALRGSAIGLILGLLVALGLSLGEATLAGIYQTWLGSGLVVGGLIGLCTGFSNRYKGHPVTEGFYIEKTSWDDGWHLRNFCGCLLIVALVFGAPMACSWLADQKIEAVIAREAGDPERTQMVKHRLSKLGLQLSEDESDVGRAIRTAWQSDRKKFVRNGFDTVWKLFDELEAALEKESKPSLEHLLKLIASESPAERLSRNHSDKDRVEKFQQQLDRIAQKSGESPGAVAGALLQEWRPLFRARKKDLAYNLLWFTQLVNSKIPNDGKQRKVGPIARQVAEVLRKPK